MGGSDEEKFDHPTQKPIELMRRPILNHTRRGEGVYDRSWAAGPHSPPPNSPSAFATASNWIRSTSMLS